jgi:hypothetical protein
MDVFAGIFTSTGKATAIVAVEFEGQRALLGRGPHASFWESARLKIKGQDDGSFIWEYTPQHDQWGMWRLIWVENNQPWPKPK